MADENGWEGNFTVHNFLYLFNFVPCEFVTYSKIYRFKGFFLNPCLLFLFPEIGCSYVLVEKDELARSHVEVKLQTASPSVGQLLQEG